MIPDSVDLIVAMECFAETGHYGPWPDSLVRSVRRQVLRRLRDGEDDPSLSSLH